MTDPLCVHCHQTKTAHLRLAMAKGFDWDFVLVCPSGTWQAPQELDVPVRHDTGTAEAVQGRTMERLQADSTPESLATQLATMTRERDEAQAESDQRLTSWAEATRLLTDLRKEQHALIERWNVSNGERNMEAVKADERLTAAETTLATMTAERDRAHERPDGAEIADYMKNLVERMRTLDSVIDEHMAFLRSDNGLGVTMTTAEIAKETKALLAAAISRLLKEK